jgi:hypothetical protein
MRSRAWAGAVLVAAVILSACGDEKITGVPYEPLFGTWTAVAFNNAPLPILQPHQQGSLLCQLRTNSLQLTFDNAGRYSSVDDSEIQCGTNPPQNASDPRQGTYRVVGNTLFLRATGMAEQSTEISLQGDVLVIQLYDNQGTPLPLELHRTGN